MPQKEINKIEQEMRECIHVLELMIKSYEERGGGYSQKQALSFAISLIAIVLLQELGVR